MWQVRLPARPSKSVGSPARAIHLSSCRDTFCAAARRGHTGNLPAAKLAARKGFREIHQILQLDKDLFTHSQPST